MSYKFRFFRRGAAGGCTGLFVMLTLLVFVEIIFIASQEFGLLPEMDIFTAALTGGLFSFGAVILYYITARNLTSQGERAAYGRMKKEQEGKE